MADFKQIIEESFSQYSGAVIQSRALIDVRDCLKPSARQIFFCMNKDKFTADKPFQKTLKAVGSAMQVYIHGDSSCEGIIMRAGQPFALRYPLIEVEGSYGNAMESGNWAAARYTGSRLSRIAKYLFNDLDKDTIEDWRDNYDDTLQYPAVLPSKGFYNIVNGTQGIGVGLASSIPAFNLREVNNALITLIRNPAATFEEIYCAPDFATGGTIINEKAVKESLRNGTGKACMIRAKIDYDAKKHTLTVVEIPYNVYTNTICTELEAIVNGADNPGIDRFNDLTGLEPCIKIYLDKNAQPDYIINFLYKNTSLQSAYGINMTMLDNGKFPKVFGWKEALQAHLVHEKEVYINSFKYDLDKIAFKIKINEAIIKAIASIEEVINLIKSSSSTAEANLNLQKLLAIDEEQAKAILDIKLAKLARLEIEKYENELAELKKEFERITKILASEELLNNEIIKGLEEVANKFGDDRRTIMTNIEIPKEDKDIANVEPEKCVVIMTEGGLIKRIPADSFKSQRRNGKGIKTQDDITNSIIRTNTIDSLMVFSNKGNMYRLLVNDIPEGTNTTKGQSVKTLVSMEVDEQPTIIYSIYRDTDAKYVLFATKNGTLKKTDLDEYVKTKRKNGICAITLRDGDKLASVSLVKDEDIILITKNGMSIRMPASEIPKSSRVTIGLKGITLTPGDEIIACLPIRDINDDVAVFTKDGMAKRVALSEFPVQNRAGKGVIVYRPNENTGNISAATLINSDDMVLISGNTTSICILGSDIPVLGRAAAGVSVIKDKNIISVSKV